MDSCRDGFVLLIVLFAVAMLSAVTGTLAWGISTRSLCTDSRVAGQRNNLALAGALYVIAQKCGRGQSAAEIQKTGGTSGTVRLGSTVIHYRAWDEASKLRFVAGNSPEAQQDLKVWGLRLRSDKDKPAAAEGLLLFEDVFEIGFEELPKIYGPNAEGRAVVEGLTLWSDGRLNINTAEDEVLRRHLKGMEPEKINRLLQLRKSRYIGDVRQLPSLLGLNRRDQRIVSMKLTTRTRRLGVRLICKGRTLRTDAFVVVDVEGGKPVIRLWRDLPPIGQMPESEEPSSGGIASSPGRPDPAGKDSERERGDPRAAGFRFGAIG